MTDSGVFRAKTNKGGETALDITLRVSTDKKRSSLSTSLEWIVSSAKMRAHLTVAERNSPSELPSASPSKFSAPIRHPIFVVLQNGTIINGPLPFKWI